MKNKIDAYLEALEKEMAGLDAALIRDALSDAGEHLRTAAAVRMDENSDLSEEKMVEKIISRYGSPAETEE